MIGVDIIDLSCSFDPLKHSLEDYKKRILNKVEYVFCDTFMDLHCLWAMKESAYKCHYKSHGEFFMDPKRILITHVDKDACVFYASINDEFYHGSFYIQPAYAYAISSPTSVSIEGREVFISAPTHIGEHDTEMAHFFNELGPNASFLLHKEGFPQGIVMENNHYGYSRSHHGAYYISVITPIAYN